MPAGAGTGAGTGAGGHGCGGRPDAKVHHQYPRNSPPAPKTLFPATPGRPATPGAAELLLLLLEELELELELDELYPNAFAAGTGAGTRKLAAT